MDCKAASVCGGCRYRDMKYVDYCALKQKHFLDIVSPLISEGCRVNQPIFIADSSRRRASLAFELTKQGLVLGFNQKSSHQLVDVKKCPLLTAGINQTLPFIRNLLCELGRTPCVIKKGKKSFSTFLTKGDVFVCEADNGIDLVLEYDIPLGLDHRMIIFEQSQTAGQVIRISHRANAFAPAETIIEKLHPTIKIGNYDVSIPAGTFLQPSSAGQKALTDLVLRYIKGCRGQIADLFCGVGTFSYVLADLPDVKITAVDSSADLLKGFSDSVNRNQIKNITIINKNLFKYPPDENELKNFSAIVFDPPRAGASSLCKSLASAGQKPGVVVGVSCNPATFVNDAKELISGGYTLQEITMVDQFIYSDHSELVAFFTKRDM